LKPITFEKLNGVFEKFSTMKKIFKSDIDYLVANSSSYKNNFLVRVGKKLLPLRTSEIAYFYSEENICYITSYEPKKFLSNYTLFELEEMLDPKMFFRVNRQYIVNRDMISHLESYVNGQVKLHFKNDITESTIISREKTPLIKNWLSN
jgi:DNA-binding LytR/AlgR family response regulator